jgi:hypothetical protein
MGLDELKDKFEGDGITSWSGNGSFRVKGNPVVWVSVDSSVNWKVTSRVVCGDCAGYLHSLETF